MGYDKVDEMKYTFFFFCFDVYQKSLATTFVNQALVVRVLKYRFTNMIFITAIHDRVSCKDE